MTLASPATEMLLALGQEENIAGYAMHENEIPEKYQAAFDSLHHCPWLNVSREEITAADPGWC